MANEEAEQIEKATAAIVELGAISIICNWVDSRGGYVVVVNFGQNQTCQAVDTNRIAAYELARQAAVMKKASMP